jgi:type IX secretion system PorP/SprF family membrane protein
MQRYLKKNIVLGLFMIVTLSVFGQQDPLYTQYMNDPILINPAYAGSRGNLSMNGVFRKQWVGIDWEPTTTSITINSPFLNYKIGVGFTFIYDKIGPLQQTGLYFDYAHHIRFTQEKTLSLGLKAGLNIFDRDLVNLLTTDYDNYIYQNDREPVPLPNVGIGAYYYTQDYYVGFSIPKLFRNYLDKTKNTYELVGKEDRVYYITAGAVFDAIPPILKLKPTFLTRFITGAPPSVELGLTAIAYDRFWGGLMWRIGDAVAAHLRFQATDQLQIGYSYDLTNSRLNQYSSGSHEILISYVFTREGERILSPRYF